MERGVFRDVGRSIQTFNWTEAISSQDQWYGIDTVFQNNGMDCLESRLQVLLAQINVQGVIAHICIVCLAEAHPWKTWSQVIELEDLRDFKDLGV